jgi:uncharacterized delta-60 repeat protein
MPSPLLTRRGSRAAAAVASLVVAATLVLAPGAAHAAGTYDPTFVGGGKATFGGGGIRPQALDRGAADQLVAVSIRTQVQQGQVDVRVFNPAGVPDPSFAGTGSLQVGAGADWSIPAVSVDRTRGLVYVSAYAPGPNLSRIWRFTLGGSLDPSWGTGGAVQFATARLTDITVSADGRLLVADRSSVYRLTAAGAVDASFGAGGGVALPTAIVDRLTVQGDGAILAAARGGDTLDVFRLTANGGVDTGFGANGRASFRVAPPINAWSIAGIQPTSAVEQNDGSVVLAGGVVEANGTNQRDALVVVRFTRTGAFDSTFAAHRDYQYSVSGPVALQGNDKALIPVSRSNGAGFVRLQRNGAFDTAWGAGGVFFDPGATRATQVVVERPGRVVGVGFTAGESGLMWGLTGDATPTCKGRYATAYGDSGANTFLGTPGSDVVVGRGGADRIRGGAGNDRICGNGGKDRIDAGKGKDIVLGGGKADSVKGGPGNDHLKGGDGDDHLRGEKGRDTLKGGSGNDHLDGGPGHDRLTGGPGRDRLHQ